MGSNAHNRKYTRGRVQPQQEVAALSLLCADLRQVLALSNVMWRSLRTSSAWWSDTATCAASLLHRMEARYASVSCKEEDNTKATPEVQTSFLSE